MLLSKLTSLGVFQKLNFVTMPTVNVNTRPSISSRLTLRHTVLHVSCYNTTKMLSVVNSLKRNNIKNAIQIQNQQTISYALVTLLYWIIWLQHKYNTNCKNSIMHKTTSKPRYAKLHKINKTKNQSTLFVIIHCK